MSKSKTIEVGDRVTKRCHLYMNQIYNSGNIGDFLDLLLEGIKHPNLSDPDYTVVGHGGSDRIEFEVSGYYEDEEGMRLDGVK